MTLQRVAIGSILLLITIYAGLMIIGLVTAIIWGKSAALYFAYFKDLLTISFIFSSILIIISLAILILQIAKFVNLIKNEIEPLFEKSKQAISTLSNTTRFIQKNAVQPIINIHAILAGLIAFLKEIIEINKLIQKKKQKETTSQENIGYPQ